MDSVLLYVDNKNFHIPLFVYLMIIDSQQADRFKK